MSLHSKRPTATEGEAAADNPQLAASLSRPDECRIGAAATSAAPECAADGAEARTTVSIPQAHEKDKRRAQERPAAGSPCLLMPRLSTMA